MCNSRPIFRVGTTLSLDGWDGSGVSDERWSSLTRDQAVAIGERLLEVEVDFADVIAEAVQDDPILLIEDAERRGGDPRLDFSHGIIVDFQNMIFEGAHFQHRVRACITVCQHGNLSKVWFRSQCVGRREDDAADFGPPVNFTKELIEAFFEEASAMGDQASEAILARYNLELQAYADTTFAGWRIQQVPQKVFTFRGFDSNKGEVADLFEQLRHGYPFVDFMRKLVRAAPEIVHPTMIAVDLAHPDDLGGIDTLNALAGDRTYSVYDPHSVYGDIGVFVRHQTQVDDLPGDEYFGIAFDPKAESDHDTYNLSESPVFRVTAEMLAAAIQSNRP